VSERTLHAVLPESAPEAGARSGARPGPKSRPALALAIILTCQLMLTLDATVMNVALPRIEAGLHFSPSSLAWVLDAYTLTFGGLLLLGGRLGDLYGRRRMFTGGILLFTLASLAGGLATSSEWLLTARVLQGVGAAAAGPSAIALLNSTFTETKARVRALSLFAGMSSAGFALGLIVGGLLTEAASWRLVLFINVPFGLVAGSLAPRYLKQPPRHDTRLDIGGAICATGGVGLLVYGLIHAASSGWANALSAGPIAVGAVLLVTFVLLQARSKHPLLPLHLFKDRNRSAAYANYFLGPAAGFSSFFFLTQYLQDVLHYSPVRTGLAFLPMSTLIFTMSRLIPRLLPRFGPKPLTIVGTLLLLAGLIGFTQIGAHTPYFPNLLWPMVVMGLGMGLAFSPLMVVIMRSVQPRDAAAAGGTMQTVQQTGVSLGIAVLVSIASTAAKHHPATATISSTQTAMIASAVISACTVLVALTFRREARQS
jgi:EmrB/QacA subfamily drug resistance transporter